MALAQLDPNAAFEASSQSGCCDDPLSPLNTSRSSTLSAATEPFMTSKSSPPAIPPARHKDEPAQAHPRPSWRTNAAASCEEEKKTDAVLTQIAESVVNQHAEWTAS
jgi:hypothetical protein